jgi:hypothetical protein
MILQHEIQILVRTLPEDQRNHVKEYLKSTALLHTLEESAREDLEDFMDLLWDKMDSSSHPHIRAFLGRHQEALGKVY